MGSTHFGSGSMAESQLIRVLTDKRTLTTSTHSPGRGSIPGRLVMEHNPGRGLIGRPAIGGHGIIPPLSTAITITIIRHLYVFYSDVSALAHNSDTQTTYCIPPPTYQNKLGGICDHSPTIHTTGTDCPTPTHIGNTSYLNEGVSPV